MPVPHPDEETLLLSFPSAGPSKLCFVHGGTDIWLLDLSGAAAEGPPRRILSGNGTLANLRISPDEQYVAYSGNECGQWAVYVQHLGGGLPQRLTFHPGNGVAAHNRGGWKCTVYLAVLVDQLLLSLLAASCGF